MALSPLDTWDISAFEIQHTLGRISDKAEETTLQSLAALIGNLTAKQVHDEALTYIERTIFNKDDLLRRKNSQASQLLNDVLPDTFQTLASSPEVHAWMNSAASDPSVLLLTGEAGTGKSALVNALKWKLDGIQASSTDSDANTYVALHEFTSDNIDQKSMALSKNSSSLLYALKCMALQIASQNRAYANDLRQRLQVDQSISQSQDAGALWTDLRLFKLDAAQNSKLYLLFDGLKTGHQEAQILSFADKLFAGDQARHTSLKICVLLTGGKDTLRLLRLPLLDVATITESLMLDYVARKLERLVIFQTKDEKSRVNHQRVIECLARPKYMTFTEIDKNLQSLHEAIEQNESLERLDEILLYIPDSKYPWSLDANKELFERTISKLSPKHLAELNSIFAWYLYCERPLRLPELEAALYVESEHESFEPLERKLKGRYSDIITSYDDFVSVQVTMKDYLEKLSEHSSDTGTDEDSVIDLTISLKNVTEPVFHQFVWDLNQKFGTGKSDVTSCSPPKRTSIRINKFEAQLKIVRACLKILNEGYDRNSEAFFNYARDYLPKHLSRIATDIGKISRDDQKFIGQNLAALLSNPCHLCKDRAGFGEGGNWLMNSEDIDSVRSILRRTQHLMPSREQNWTRNVLNEPEDTLPTMKLWAQLNGKLWLQSELTLAYESIATPFQWLDTFVEAAILAETRSKTHGSSESVNPANIVWVVPGTYDKVVGDGTLVWNLSRSHGDDREPKKNVTTHKVERALSWLEKQHLDIKRDNRHHLILAATYHAIGEFGLARKHFEIVSHDDALKKYALFGLAKTCLEENAGNAEEGFKYMRDVIRIVSPDSSNGMAIDRDLYIKYLTHLGTVYYNSGRKSDAISTWKELLTHTPEDHSTRKETFRCMCIWGDSTEARRFLEQWLDYSNQSGNKGLADLFCEDGIACAESSYIQTIRKDQKLLVLLQKIASDAAQLADQKFDQYGSVRPSLMYYQGLTTLMGASPERRELAREVWEEALYSRMPSGHDAMEFQRGLQPIANRLVQFKFDSVLAELQAGPFMTEGRKTMLSRDFEDYIHSPALHRAGYQAYDASTAFTRASFAAMMGNLHEARRLWSSGMTRALNYLSDNDPNNQNIGVYWLLRSFPAVKEKIGLLTAFSMCDRQKRLASRTPSSSEANNTVSNIDEQALSGDSQIFYCPACSTTLNSWEPEGLWMCMFCERQELCSECYRQFKSGEQNLWFCNPIHEYVHLVHTDYAEDEVAPGKVLIDWEYEPVEDGKFARRGGRIVDIAEWVEMLRVQWNISASSGALQDFDSGLYISTCG